MMLHWATPTNNVYNRYQNSTVKEWILYPVFRGFLLMVVAEIVQPVANLNNWLIVQAIAQAVV